jgi:predicted nucleic acid-binding protein
MPEPPVANASPLNVLARAGRLELLRALGRRIVVPDAVAEEVTEHADEATRALWAEEWLVRVPTGGIAPAVAAWDLGAGESAVLSWAASHPGCVAVIDDYAARTCAEVIGVTVIGTLGLALRAKLAGRVALARPLVEELRRAGLYLSSAVIRSALTLVGE